MNTRPPLPKCCACGFDVIACLELIGPRHLIRDQITNRRRLNKWRKAIKTWSKSNA